MKVKFHAKYTIEGDFEIDESFYASFLGRKLVTNFAEIPREKLLKELSELELNNLRMMELGFFNAGESVTSSHTITSLRVE